MIRVAMARQTIQIGQIYCKSDDLSRRRWQVTQLFQHPDGIHAALVRLDDPTRCITLSADALSDRRLMRRLPDAPPPGQQDPAQPDTDWLPRATWAPAAAGD
jgi:hypothetical protein